MKVKKGDVIKMLYTPNWSTRKLEGTLADIIDYKGELYIDYRESPVRETAKYLSSFELYER